MEYYMTKIEAIQEILPPKKPALQPNKQSIRVIERFLSGFCPQIKLRR
jgi:hypothetical protein